MEHTIVTRGGKRLRPLTVVRFMHGDGLGRTMFALDYGKRHPAYLFYRRDDAVVTVLRDDVPCGTICCELHRCDRGPGATFCMEHWRLPAIS
jgi:hypothetical protein